MNNDKPGFTVHLPLTLLSLAIAALFATQIGAGKQSAGLMQWQIETTTKNLEDMRTLEKQYADNIADREKVVTQSGELQGQLQALLTDLLELAKTDSDAKKIIQKWNVQNNADASAASPSPASTEP